MFSKLTPTLSIQQKIQAQADIFEQDYVQLKAEFELCLAEPNINFERGNLVRIKVEALAQQLDSYNDQNEDTMVNDGMIKLMIKILIFLSKISAYLTETNFMHLETISFLIKALILLDDNYTRIDYVGDSLFFAEVSYCLAELISFSPKESLLSFIAVNNFESSIAVLNELLINLNGWCPERVNYNPKLNLYEFAITFANFADLSNRLKYQSQQSSNLTATLQYINANLSLFAFRIQTSTFDIGHFGNNDTSAATVAMLLSIKNSAERMTLLKQLAAAYLLPSLNELLKNEVKIKKEDLEFYCTVTLDLFFYYASYLKELVFWDLHLSAKKEKNRAYKTQLSREIHDHSSRFAEFAEFQGKVLGVLSNLGIPTQELEAYEKQITEGVDELKTIQANRNQAAEIIKFFQPLTSMEPVKEKEPVKQRTTTKQNKKKQKKKNKSVAKKPQSNMQPIVEDSPLVPKEITDIHQTLQKADQARYTKNYIAALQAYELARELAAAIDNNELQVNALDGLLSLCTIQLSSLLSETDKLLSERLRLDKPLTVDKQHFLGTAIQEIDKRLLQLEKIDAFYRPLFEQKVLQLPEKDQVDAKAGYAVILQQRDDIHRHIDDILGKYEAVRQSRERFIMQLGQEVKAGLPADNCETIFDLGMKKFISLGEKNKLQGNISDFGHEKEFLSTLEDTIRTILNTKTKVFIPRPAEALELSNEANNIFAFLIEKTEQKHMLLVGSQVANLLLTKWNQPQIQANDFDFLLNTVEKRVLITAGFHHARIDRELYVGKFNGLSLDLFCLEEELVESLLKRDFTFSALAVNAQGKLFDPSGRGCADLRTKKIVVIGNPVERIKADPVIALRAVKYMMRGFNPDPALVEAIRQWQPEEHTNYGHINAVTKDILKQCKPNLFVKHLIDLQLLPKMFGIHHQELTAALSALETKLDLKPKENPFQFFPATVEQSTTPSYKDKLMNAAKPG